MEDYAVRTPPMEQLREELREIIDSGAKTLTLSGGEPTLYRDRVIALCREATSKGVQFIEIQTNAVLVDTDYAQALAEAGVTSAFISLLANTAEEHDRLAGLEGAFEPCLRGIDAFLEAGIRVALNPVIAFETQRMLPDYVDFVADRLPGVSSISCSAVQPHGRAATNHALLPDYAVLAESIRAALERAEEHGIELVNPYCGVPLCIGWESASEQSVEAFESRRGGFDTVGLDNTGNKRQGEPCHRCVLRSRCGGAWHAYWELRDGSGIQAPSTSVTPWEAEADPRFQHITHAPNGATQAHWEEIAAATTPAIWLWTTRLTRADRERIVDSPVTDVAFEVIYDETPDDRETLRSLRSLQREMQNWPDQQRIRFWWGIPMVDSSTQEPAAKSVALAHALGASGVTLLAPSEPWTERFLHALRLRFPNLECLALEREAQGVNNSPSQQE
jgi:MoaA/NifB/PqqE/SkfB family radical SAM enzyme